jgi:hypothetical protein
LQTKESRIQLVAFEIPLVCVSKLFSHQKSYPAPVNSRPFGTIRRSKALAYCHRRRLLLPPAATILVEFPRAPNAILPDGLFQRILSSNSTAAWPITARVGRRMNKQKRARQGDARGDGTHGVLKKQMQDGAANNRAISQTRPSHDTNAGATTSTSRSAWRGSNEVPVGLGRAACIVN